MNSEPASAHVRLTDDPTEEQRLGRICELLSKAVVADWTDRIIGERAPPVLAKSETLRTGETSDRQRIVDYLALVGGQAAPATIRATLGLPRMRLYRAIQPMLANGRLVATGHTNTISYRLTPAHGIDPARN